MMNFIKNNYAPKSPNQIERTVDTFSDNTLVNNNNDKKEERKKKLDCEFNEGRE